LRLLVKWHTAKDPAHTTGTNLTGYTVAIGNPFSYQPVDFDRHDHTL